MNVLIAVDFSPVSKAMIEAVPSLVRSPESADPHFFLVHVAEPDPAFVGWEAGPDVVRDQMAQEFHREHEQLAGLADDLRASGATNVTPLLIQGPTVEAILEQSHKLNATLLVVGSHGRGKTWDVLVGSISSALIRKSEVPVLVVPSRAGQP